MALATLAATGVSIYESGALDSLFGGGSNNYFGPATRTNLCPGSPDPRVIESAMRNSPANEAERIRNIVTNANHRRTWDATQIAILLGGGEQCKPESQRADWALEDERVIRDWINRWADAGSVSGAATPTASQTDHLRALAGDLYGAGSEVVEAIGRGDFEAARAAAAGARVGAESGSRIGSGIAKIDTNTVVLAGAALAAFVFLRR